MSLVRICRSLGVTRQAYYQYGWRQEATSLEEELVLQEVGKIRENHRHMGGRKLYEKLQPFLLEHQIKMGRDALFDLLSSHRLLIRRKKRRIRTTQSHHWLYKYSDLVKNHQPTRANALWVADITYWRIKQGFLYISFLTDAFSHKIVGYHVAETLEAVECVKALKMALNGLTEPPDFLIHHSDRGLQYCSSEYVSLLEKHSIQISMTETGSPYDNPKAERINGIIKGEYLEGRQIKSYAEAKAELKRVVELYNTDRPHMSIGYLVPEKVHQGNIQTENLWRNKRKLPPPELVNPFPDCRKPVNTKQD